VTTDRILADHFAARPGDFFGRDGRFEIRVAGLPAAAATPTTEPRDPSPLLADIEIARGAPTIELLERPLHGWLNGQFTLTLCNVAFDGSNLPAAAVKLTDMNFGSYPMGNGLTRLGTRFLSDPKHVDTLKEEIGEAIDAEAADELGLITFTPDDIDWEDEVRIGIEARAAFSPDALTGMEASLRFGGPETLESKIFSRLSAWQNWIFQRPNAVGDKGALRVYGTGQRSEFDRRRV